MPDTSDTNFHQLFIFHTVAQSGSFTRAARELDITQPAVSIQVKELERSLGTVLLERRRRGVGLSDTGETVYGYTKRIFSLADEMRLAIQDIESLQSGRLTIGSSSTPGEYILPVAIGVFKERYPKIEVALSISNTQELVEKILDRELDMGMAGDVVEMDGLRSFTYVNDEVALVASATHKLALKSGRLSLRDIADEPFIMRERGSATRKAAMDALREKGIEPKVAMELGSNEAVKRAAAAGLGLGALSKFSLGPDLAAGYLRVLRVSGWRCERPLTVFYRNDGHMTTVQEAFLKLLEVEKPLPAAPY